MSNLPVSRRTALGLISAGGAIALVSGGRALAARDNLNRILVDQRLTSHELLRIETLFPGVLARKSIGPIELETVRQWRTELGAKVNTGDPLELVTKWDNFLIFRGLARESRSKFTSISLGRGTFFLTIAKSV